MTEPTDVRLIRERRGNGTWWNVGETRYFIGRAGLGGRRSPFVVGHPDASKGACDGIGGPYDTLRDAYAAVLHKVLR